MEAPTMVTWACKLMSFAVLLFMAACTTSPTEQAGQPEASVVPNSNDSRAAYQHATSALDKVAAAVAAMEALESYQVDSSLSAEGTPTEATKLAVSSSTQMLYQRSETNDGIAEILVRGDKAYQRGTYFANALRKPELANAWGTMPPNNPLVEALRTSPLTTLMVYGDSFSNATEGSQSTLNDKKVTHFEATVDPHRLLTELRSQFPALTEGATADEIAASYPSSVELLIGDDGVVHQTKGYANRGVAPGLMVNVFSGFNEEYSFPAPSPLAN